FYLQSFSQIKSIKDTRFHTRFPVIIPQRITSGLVSTLKKHQKHFRTLSIAIHCNHPQELDDEIKEAITKLADFNLLSQTVLLREVNDDPQLLLELFNTFLDLG